MAKGKGNKDVLKAVNYSMDTIKQIKEGKILTKEDKQAILIKFVGLSEDNNSYYTPVPICNFIKELLDIKHGKIADLSAGIGNMCIPFIKEYGQLQDEIQFDMYELDENTSLAGAKAWEDYSQINYYGNFNTLLNTDKIPNDYDFIIGNPPFTGTEEYMCEWNNNKDKPKKNQLIDAFIDLAVNKCRDNGYIALIVPGGFLFKGNATQKLRNWLRSKVALKGIFPLDSETFSDAGILGTGVGTYLIIFQKSVQQGQIFIGELTDKKNLELEMKSLADQFRLFLSNEYYITYENNQYYGTYGLLKEGELFE